MSRHTPRLAALLVVSAAVAATVTGCAGGSSSPSPATVTVTAPTADSPVDVDSRATDEASEAPALDASTLATAMKSELATVKRVVDLTEDTDGNNLLGRPHGYSSATVLVDKNGQCGDGPGVDCGATIEVFADEADAKARAEYIDAVTGAASIFAEYDTRSGTALLRVSGSLKPSVAEQYKAAFLRAVEGIGA